MMLLLYQRTWRIYHHRVSQFVRNHICSDKCHKMFIDALNSKSFFMFFFCGIFCKLPVYMCIIYLTKQTNIVVFDYSIQAVGNTFFTNSASKIRFFCSAYDMWLCRLVLKIDECMLKSTNQLYTPLIAIYQIHVTSGVLYILLLIVVPVSEWLYPTGSSAR